MSDSLLFTMTLVAALGCGLVAGVFFAFSTFIMKALSRRPPSEGIAAMQAINVDVLNVWFLGLFLGTAALCAIALVVSVLRWQHPGSELLLVGGVLYLIGTFGVTAACNIPRNNLLATTAPTDPGSEAVWEAYVAGWTAWNHVRTVAALASSASFCIALGR
jgi:uncharacterized membrane protein